MMRRAMLAIGIGAMVVVFGVTIAAEEYRAYLERELRACGKPVEFLPNWYHFLDDPGSQEEATGSE